jgi:hypothetical protein
MNWSHGGEALGSVGGKVQREEGGWGEEYSAGAGSVGVEKKFVSDQLSVIRRGSNPHDWFSRERFQVDRLGPLSSVE